MWNNLTSALRDSSLELNRFERQAAGNLSLSYWTVMHTRLVVSAIQEPYTNVTTYLQSQVLPLRVFDKVETSRLGKLQQ